VSWALIPETDWKLIITLPESEVFKSVQTLSGRLNRFAWLMVIGLLIFYFIFFIVLYRQSKKMSKSISEPLERIDEMVGIIATGN
jgi:sensor histidine kinase YesM